MRKIIEDVIDGEAIVIEKLSTGMKPRLELYNYNFASGITANHDDTSKKSHCVRVDFSILSDPDPDADQYSSALWCCYDLQQLDKALTERIHDHPIITIFASAVSSGAMMLVEFLLLLFYLVAFCGTVWAGLQVEGNPLADAINPSDCRIADYPAKDCGASHCNRVCVGPGFMEECSSGDTLMCQYSVLFAILWIIQLTKVILQMLHDVLN